VICRRRSGRGEGDGIGVEVGAVVKFDALAQVEDPSRVVHLVDFPAGGEPRGHIGGLVGVLEIPVDQRVESRKAEKAEAFSAIIRNAARRRDVGRSHADTQDLVRLRWSGVASKEGNKAQGAE
jgi:hypothetical protein